MSFMFYSFLFSVAFTVIINGYSFEIHLKLLLLLVKEEEEEEKKH
jgi:hypothetical protein